MMLVDTSVWVSHFKGMEVARPLGPLLGEDRVLGHPFVLGELVLGGLQSDACELLASLTPATRAEDAEVLQLVRTRKLMSQGIGWVDAHLLASALLSAVALWTLDRSLAAVASANGVRGL